MSESRTLVSSWTVVTNTEFRSDQLKLCYLWYDEVLFETLGQYDEARFFSRLVGDEANSGSTIKHLTDIIVPLNRRIGNDVLGDPFDPTRIGYPRWGHNNENYTYPEPESAEQFAHNCLLQSIEAEHGVTRFQDEYDIEQAEGRARVAVDAVLLWERVNAEVACMLETGPDEKLAMLSAQQFSSGIARMPTPFSLFEIAVPSLSHVSWGEIVKLRMGGGLDFLREKIAHILKQASLDLSAAKKQLDEIEKETIETILEAGRPKGTRIAKIAIESLVGNAPVPGILINPVGVFLGVRDTYQGFKKAKQMSWIYMLRDIRKAAESAEDGSSH